MSCHAQWDFTPLLATFLCTAFFLVATSIYLAKTRIFDGTRPAYARSSGSSTHALIVLGSGGHTAEMLAMLRTLDPLKVTFRTYIVSSGDEFSAKKALEFEGSLKARVATHLRDLADQPYAAKLAFVGEGSFQVKTVPRARRIYQPLYTAPWSSFRCFLGCLKVLTSSNHGFPDVIITNGPATAVIVILAALTLKLVCVANPSKMRTVYVESFARVKKLSLSGRLLLNLVDRFLVQWEILRLRVGEKAEYRGILV